MQLAACRVQWEFLFRGRIALKSDFSGNIRRCNGVQDTQGRKHSEKAAFSIHHM
jgi:hypothetical protein